jgi:OHCU decarboxylase
MSLLACFDDLASLSRAEPLARDLTRQVAALEEQLAVAEAALPTALSQASEQAGAALIRLGALDAERARFTELNDVYKARFGFPFIMAVKGRSKGEIMDAFERRIAHDRDQEFATALTEISRIALLRLGDMLPG